jgi:glycosyltransferase involved in cell wall biosynthesis
MGSGDEVGVADHAERFPNIHVCPPVPHEEVVKLVREADCGICLREGRLLSGRLSLPNKLFEYAFAGIPVLASRLPEMERVVSEYGLGVCCDNDADSIESAIRKIEREGIARPVADLTELSWDTQAKRLQEAYRQLLSNRGAAVPTNEGDC